MTDRQEFARSQTSAAIAGMMVMTKMETTEERNLNRKRATIASPDEHSKMETAPLRKRGRALLQNKDASSNRKSA